MDIWTVVQTAEGETFPWAGAWKSLDEAVAAVQESLDEVWGDTEKHTIGNTALDESWSNDQGEVVWLPEYDETGDHYEVWAFVRSHIPM